jgi:hypothetical protein
MDRFIRIFGIRSLWIMTLVFLFFFPCQIIQAQSWQKIDSLQNSGLPRSALKLVDQKLASAKANQNRAEFIKAIIYKISLEASFEENVYPRVMHMLQEEIRQSQTPVKEILCSIFGEWSWSYWMQHQYAFRERSWFPGIDTLSPDQWDASTFLWFTTQAYRRSLAPIQELQDKPIEDYKNILISVHDARGGSLLDSLDMNHLHPTLFDFLSQRALRFFTNAQYPVAKPVNGFQLNQQAFFAPSMKFVKYPLKPQGIQALPGDGPFKPAGTDTLSMSWYALRIFQELERFHLNNKDPQALIQVLLERLTYMNRNAQLPNRESLYIQALETALEEFSYSPASTEIAYTLASYLVDHDPGYALEQINPDAKDGARWNLKKALNICMMAVEKYPESTGGRNCALLIKKIMAPKLKITTEYAIVPNKHTLFSIAHKRIVGVNIRVLRTNPEQYPQQLNRMNDEEILKYLNTLEIVQDFRLDIPLSADYRIHNLESVLPALEPGFYVLFASTDADFRNPAVPFAHQGLWVTSISYVTQKRDNGGLDVVLMDREDGKPLDGIQASIFIKNYDKRSRNYTTTQIGETISDKEGLISLQTPQDGRPYNRVFLKLESKEEEFTTKPFYIYPNQPVSVDRTIENTRFFTDRSIYRPGQTIHFKGIMLERTGDSTILKTGKQTMVKLYDVHGKMVSQQKFTSDSYGAFSGSFIAPTGTLLGNMRISNESGSVTFSVEAYKRPTFEVLFDTLKSNYKLGEPIEIQGKATGYAGNPIDGASIRYRVVRNTRFPYPFRNGFVPFWNTPETEIATGTATTTPDGSFSLSFQATPDYAIPAEANPLFSFEIYVEVTDIQGETRTTSMDLSIGYQSLVIREEIPEKINLSNNQNFTIETTNLNGIPTPTEVRIKIEQLSPPDRPLRKRAWATPDTIYFAKKYFLEDLPNDPYLNEDDPATWPIAATLFEGSVVSGDTSGNGIGGSGFKFSDPGIYQVTLEANDPWGKPVKESMLVTVYQPESKHLPSPQCFWYVPLKVSGIPGETAQFLIGTSYKNQKILKEIRVENKLQSREWIRISNEQKLISIPIKPSFQGNFSVSFVFVAENRAYQISQLITVPYPSKKLNITLESFREKMVPGSTETWKIRITDPEKQGIVASMLANMYDRSLDLFRPHNWNFSLYQKYFHTNPFEVNAGFGTSSSASRMSSFPQPLEWYQPYGLNWFGLYLPSGNQFYYHESLMSKDQPMARDAMPEAEPMVAGAPGEEQNISQYKAADPNNGGGTQKSPDQPEQPGVMPVRTDFRETAFFYPSLLSSKTGEIGFSFKVPDALTSWKFMGLAYTKDLDHGIIQEELVSQKDLMVFPNAPRFVRQGDTVILKAKIVNLSDHEIVGKAMLDLSESITRQSLHELIQHQGNTSPMIRNFTIGASQSQSVSWTLVIPESPFVQVIRYRVSAQSGIHRDGEENILPVLPSRVMVTETMPLPVPGKGTFDFAFDKLLGLAPGGLKPGTDGKLNYRLTLEFASNPAWYAVQALPALDQGNHTNATKIFNALYANAVGSHIANGNPKIRRVFEQWKAMNPEAQLSQLEKKEDLKLATLDETPWLLDAQDEAENRKKLGLFFDMNTLQHRLDEQVLKLVDLQQPSGGWPWFPGMRPNLTVTLQIMTGIGRMDHLMIRYSNQENNMGLMTQKGIHYLQQELIRQYQDLKKRKNLNINTYLPTATQVRMLFALSYFIGRINPNALLEQEQNDIREAMTFFKERTYKTWLKQELMVQGMVALTAFRNGESDLAKQILKSLSERALHNPELGMYWAENRGYRWYQAPIERQALFIEAFEEIVNDRESVNEMKTWLLKQKQTQQWPTNSATTDACYALIMRGGDLLATDPGVVIRIGDQRIDPANDPRISKEAGTGYFRMSWTGDQIRPEMGHVAVTKATEGIAWGGLYWQYFQKLDHITQHATPLKVKKQLINTTNTTSTTGTTFTTSTTSSPHHPTTYQIGDIITIRLTITSDRDMSFVHLKDLRAAGFEPYISSTQSPQYPDTPTSRNPLSGYRYQGGLGYYQETTDVATNFFLDYLPKGTWVLEYKLVANNAGDFSEGIATIQCYYAPEFGAHTGGSRIEIDD